MPDHILQRVVMPPKRRVRRLYYRCNRPKAVRQRGRFSFVLACGARLRTNTFFNSFFESYWREYTGLKELALRFRVQGIGIARIYRLTSEGKTILECKHRFSCPHREACIDLPVNQGKGILFFEIESLEDQTRLSHVVWIAREVKPKPTRFVVGICTYNRAPLLLETIKIIFADRYALEKVECLIIVDQGDAKVRECIDFPAVSGLYGTRLKLIEQPNRGGAGGFTRCLLEATKETAATHILLMDDDIALETESIIRAAAFLSLARSDIAVGGHMLDSSRPCELVESGSRYLPESIRIDQPRRQSLNHCDALRPFLRIESRHYSAWWFFAFPRQILDRVGLPSPLFLRGDDVEFGCRLLRNRIQTISMPGIAVWHESFEAKGRSWHPFYELRNLLIVGALHFPEISARVVARQFFSRLLDELLTFDYHEAQLMCEAVAAYLRGPDHLCDQKNALHHRVVALRDSFPVSSCPRDRVPNSRDPLSSSRLRESRFARWRLLWRNFTRCSPSPDAAPRHTVKSGEQWYDIADADVVAVDESRRRECLVLRRSRSHFVDLFIRGVWLALRLFVSHRRTTRRWREGGKTLNSFDFWTRYLNVTESLVPDTKKRRAETPQSERASIL
jgi:galactofuranosylgalactofuranosylrhamnosyl-N-acetylglucosaminyl-diphospho-decaprenol beta-1,5/1,6-galactofuranosyltransferase